MKSLKEWNEVRKRRRAMRVFMTLYKDPKSTMQGILKEAAFKMGREMFMKMLDAEGFAHCLFCPVRGPLQKHAMGMMCKGHFDMANREPIKDPTQKQEDTSDGRTTEAPRPEAA